jgi:hypothetical protein
MCEPGFKTGLITYDKAGIASSLSKFPIDPISVSLGDSVIEGNPPQKYDFQYSNLRVMADYLVNRADFKFDYDHNEILHGYSDEWGKPTPSIRTNPIGYDGPMNIVYFNMHGNTLTLSAESHGASILIVDGNLDLHGGFTWRGVIIILGSLNYTDAGRNNITGSILCSETATIIAWDVGIIYCSDVVKKIKHLVSPLRITKWRDIS